MGRCRCPVDVRFTPSAGLACAGWVRVGVYYVPCGAVNACACACESLVSRPQETLSRRRSHRRPAVLGLYAEIGFSECQQGAARLVRSSRGVLRATGSLFGIHRLAQHGQLLGRAHALCRGSCCRRTNLRARSAQQCCSAKQEVLHLDRQRVGTLKTVPTVALDACCWGLALGGHTAAQRQVAQTALRRGSNGQQAIRTSGLLSRFVHIGTAARAAQTRVRAVVGALQCWAAWALLAGSCL